MPVRPGIRRVAAASAALLVAGCGGGSPGGEPPLIRLFDDLGDHHRPISTRSSEAQRYFDQGLLLTYGFNHEAAGRSFREAARRDPGCAICWWGVAFSLGPNINAPMGPDAAREAWAAVGRARALESAASPVERDLIEAVARRYAPEPEAADRAALDRAFAEAMQEVQRRHPDDLDVATLTAEALMDLSPWNYWASESEPKPQTREVLRLLEGVLARDPSHPGANHYLIHAYEEYQPERAVPAAERLAELAPGSGHLVHMPSHIFWRVGRYEDALEINRRAAEVDEQTFAWCGRRGLYAAIYYPHNIHFLYSAAAAEGRSDLTLVSARRLAAKIDAETLRAFPAAEEFVVMPTFALLRFGRFDAVLGQPAPPPEQRYATGVRHYARGFAHARRGDVAAAAAELASLRAVAGEEALGRLEFSGVAASRYLELAVRQLEGELAAARGETDAAVAALEEAIRVQDAMQYTEPPRWWLPVRQALGAVLLDAGRVEAAEAVYREDLRRVPRNGWSLFGLARSLTAQGREAEADAVETGFRNAWARADVELTSSRL
jgi:tetratricopeptide (TPR) repeat protein